MDKSSIADNRSIGNGVMYATDDNYVRHLTISLISLLENTNFPDFNIYIISNNVSADNLKYLLEIGKRYTKDIIIIDASKALKSLPANLNTANLSISTYIRLFSASLIPNGINKLLYLDCDTYIRTDIKNLFDISMSDFMIAGIEDTMYPHMKTNIGLDSDARYINAGIVLINLDSWRKENIQDKFIEFIDKYNGDVPHLDQGVINGVLKSRIKYLPLKYNVQSPIYAFHKSSRLLSFFNAGRYYSKEEIVEAKNDPAIIHFTSFFTGRPWEKGCIHPLRNLYRDTLGKTIFASVPYTTALPWKRRMRMLAFKYFQPLYLFMRNL